MIIISIGDQTKQLEDASERWITEQINRRKKDNALVSIKVEIKKDSINMTLYTPQPPGIGGRAPNNQEREIFELWNRLHLNTENFSGGNLVAFLKQLRSLI